MFNEKHSHATDKYLAFFKGSNENPLYHSDVNYPDYQEAFFYYLFGAVENDCFGLIDFQDKKGILFIPKADPLHQIWMNILSKDEFEKKYDIECHYVEEIE